ncbi:unnamed protein product, partial [Iphiclides podalirius]
MCCIAELRKELPSALLSLLSVQQAAPLGALIPPCIQVTNIMKPAAGKALHLPKMPMDALGAIQHALLQNNNTLAAHGDFKGGCAKRDEPDSDAEYDDTDDIVLPEETDAFYSEGGGAGAREAMGAAEAMGAMEAAGAAEAKRGEGRQTRREAAAAADEASRQFECRHCGKRYRWKSTLRRHENVECGGKAPAHQCPYCAYRAKQRGNLGVHIRKHHNHEWFLYATSKVRRSKKAPV